MLAKIVGFDGAYHRFTGKVTIEKIEKDVRVEIFDDHAIWELMYFGKTRSSHVPAYMLAATQCYVSRAIRRLADCADLHFAGSKRSPRRPGSSSCSNPLFLKT